MEKIAYIVAFNSKDPHSMLYKRYRTLDSLIETIRKLWYSQEDFIVVSLRIYRR